VHQYTQFGDPFVVSAALTSSTLNSETPVIGRRDAVIILDEKQFGPLFLFAPVVLPLPRRQFDLPAACKGVLLRVHRAKGALRAPSRLAVPLTLRAGQVSRRGRPPWRRATD
jgi:hypothetical protein